MMNRVERSRAGLRGWVRMQGIAASMAIMSTAATT
jgi:hypothetical protein